jgi:ABC-2 type transport system ATP-binding protein
MRMIMGLDRPTPGTVTVNGKPCRQHRAPLREAGGLLEASAVHPAAAPAHTCAPWPPPTTSRPPGSARSSR